MTEQELVAKHQKRKDRIKNIAIIFLVIMLLLTFFSNTIMNYSLAEVGTAYASSGTLTTKIRGDASVEAKDPVKIVTDQEAKVLKVLVKNGDKVKKGKTLFVLEGASSEELEQAMNDLVTMNYDYQKALLDIKVPDYAKNNSDIKYARKDLKQALKEIDDIKQENKEKKLEYKKLAKDAEKAKEDMDAKADLVADKEEEIANLQVVLDGYDAEITALSSTEENDTVLEKQDAVTQAERAVEDAEEAEAQYEITDGRTSSVIQGEVKAQEQVIADLQDELSEQQDALNDLLSSNAKSNDKIATHSKEISSIRSKISSIEGKTKEVSGKAVEIEEKEKEIKKETDEEKKEKLESELKKLKTDLEKLKGELSDIQGETDVDQLEGDLSKAESDLAQEQEVVENNAKDIEAARKKISKTQNKITDANTELSNLQKELQNAAEMEANLKSAKSVTASYKKVLKAAKRAKEDTESGVTKENIKKKKELEEQKKTTTLDKNEKDNELKKLTSNYTAAQEVYTEAKAAADSFQKPDETVLETARQTALEKEKALQTLYLDLAAAKKDDSLAEQVALLDSDTKKEQIRMKEEQIAEMKKEAKPKKLKASSSGIVQSVTVKAGDMTMVDTPLAEIQVKKNGFQLSVPVTIDQSKLVKKGDHASILNLWDDSVKAVLADIEMDEENPNAGRTLVFDVSGNVENGTMLSISVGEKTANYDLIVPTSAIREDSDGKFVLIIEEKSSPVGNRYIARKEQVSVITQDETQSAVTGSFDSYTSIITTASKSVEPGDYVRLAS